MMVIESADRSQGLASDQQKQLRQRWDTDCVRPVDRFGYFREGVCQTFLAHTPEKPPRSDFSARIDRLQIGRGWLGHMNVTPHTGLRTKSDIAKDTIDFLSLGLVLSGGAEIHLAGKPPRSQKRGDIFLVNCGQIRRVDMYRDDRFVMIRLLVPRYLLQDAVPQDCLDDHLIISNRPDSEAIVSCLSIMARRSLAASSSELDALYDAATSLLVANLTRERDYMQATCDAVSSTRRGLLEIIRAFVEQNIANSSLSPLMVAARFDISVRYLHKLFANESTSFSKTILIYRLERIRADLLDPACMNMPVGDIAHRWGLRDLASFHRNFKRRFDETPSAFRPEARF